MSNKRKAPDAQSTRGSSRASKAPTRFNPCGGSADIPDEFEAMAQTVAAEVAKNCEMPVSDDALKALQGALLPAMAAFVEAAHANSVTRGSNDIEDLDFDAVFNAYKQAKKSKASSKEQNNTQEKKKAKVAAKTKPAAKPVAVKPSTKAKKATKKKSK